MTDGFDTDFGVVEWHGTNAFIRDGDSVFRTYFISSRGDETTGSTWSYLDITALGRQEEWEDSPRERTGRGQLVSSTRNVAVIGVPPRTARSPRASIPRRCHG
jgi:hypothetical protein